jgi:predicted metalloprotease
VKWEPGQPRSESLEDRRGERPGGFGRGGFGGGGPPTMSLGGLLLLLALAYFFGPGLLSVLGPIETGPEPAPTPRPVPLPRTAPAPGAPPVRTDAAEEQLVDFVSFVIDDLQKTWSAKLTGYEPTRLVLFRGAVQSACGFAQAAMGPFYCPLDQKVYIDLAFYDELRRRFGAAGDFAQAYVIAHEVGHHIQRQIGVEPQVRQLQRRRPDLANELSVRMELQADCLAGVWGHSTAQRQILERGDVEEGLRAAAAIGDDNIQRRTQGYVVPEGFTHGSSEQRVAWFRRGLETGDPEACDTFGSSRG